MRTLANEMWKVKILMGNPIYLGLIKDLQGRRVGIVANSSVLT